YRVKLLDSAVIVFNRYPFFGSVNYRDELAGLGMLQGEGIVDVVNSYLDVVLEYGLVGLMLYLGFFSIILFSVIGSLRKVYDRQSDLHLLGRVLLASMMAILATIFTVSSILIIPVVYWAMAGVCIAYIRLIKGLNTKQDTMMLPRYRLATKA
ncbi:MAG: hypothetical protein WBC07_09880, partial [Methylotenera sp.]